MSDNTSRKDEEIDLGQLFALIGRGFYGIGRMLNKGFVFLKNIMFDTILFFVRHAIKLGVAITIGAVIGFVIDYIKKPQYEATMIVKPNFQSGRQLYKNIAFYDELVKQQDLGLLSKTFGISKEEAQSLVGFEIEPVVNDNYMLSNYDKFIGSVDSTVALNFTFENYKDNFKDYDFSEHEITVISSSNVIFSKLENSIILGIVNNAYFEKLEVAEKAILERNESYLKTSLDNIDTLRKVYQEVIISEAKKETSQGTNINLASNSKDSKELELFQEELRVNKDLDQLNRKRVRNAEIINVISSFQTIGFEKNHVFDKSMFRFALLAFVTLLLVLIGIEFKKNAE